MSKCVPFKAQNLALLLMSTLQLCDGEYYLTSLGENVALLSVIMPKRFLKIRLNFSKYNFPNI
jgi:hypothetical protein